MSGAFPPAPLPPLPPRRKRRLRPWMCGALGLVAFVVGVVYALHRLNITPRAERLSTLQAMPEASLLVPGSHVLDEHGSRPTSFLGLGISNEAFSYKVVGTNETQAAVLAFYTANLAQRGWQGPEPGLRSSSFDAAVAEAWQHGHYVLDVAILGPQSGTYPGETGYATAYAIEIQYTSTAAPSPMPTS
jgi:hypothetical protein